MPTKPNMRSMVEQIEKRMARTDTDPLDPEAPPVLSKTAQRELEAALVKAERLIAVLKSDIEDSEQSLADQTGELSQHRRHFQAGERAYRQRVADRLREYAKGVQHS